MSVDEYCLEVDFTEVSVDSGDMSENDYLLRQDNSFYCRQRRNGAGMLLLEFSRIRVEIPLPQVCCVSRDRKMLTDGKSARIHVKID